MTQNTMGRYKIQESIKDVIAILDSAPIHRDMFGERNIVQLTNRVPIAHLGIERGLKALITRAGITADKVHGLHKLYRALGNCDKKSADYLARAFDDAVTFYGYNPNVKGLRQFRSLAAYLCQVGTDKAFDAMRYWSIEKSSYRDSPFKYISPWVHRELLCALWSLIRPDGRETVSERVEREVRDAMYTRRQIAQGSEDTDSEQSVLWYKNWLSQHHTTHRDALKAAVHCKFDVKDDDEFVSRILCDAYDDLRQSNDPAVQYDVRTLTYLRRGSQRQHPDAIAKVKWSNRDQTTGKVLTPSGTCLGLIEKYADGSWGIESLEYRRDQAAQVAEALKDAQNYLVNRLTKRCTVTVDGESRRLRIIDRTGQGVCHDHDWTSDLNSVETRYELEFWDGGHRLQPEDRISIEVQLERPNGIVCVLKGIVTAVEVQKVSITGTNTFTSRVI